MFPLLGVPSDVASSVEFPLQSGFPGPYTLILPVVGMFEPRHLQTLLAC